MKNDVTIKFTDGQSLLLHKITEFLDPIILTYKSAPGEKA